MTLLRVIVIVIYGYYSDCVILRGATGMNDDDVITTIIG